MLFRCFFRAYSGFSMAFLRLFFGFLGFFRAFLGLFFDLYFFYLVTCAEQFPQEMIWLPQENFFGVETYDLPNLG